MPTTCRRKRRYPKDWKRLACICKERVGWKCEECHEEQFAEKISKRTGRVYQMRLHAAHIGRYTTRPRLKALCPSCHATMDWQRRQRQAQVRLERMKHVRFLRHHLPTSAYA